MSGISFLLMTVTGNVKAVIRVLYRVGTKEWPTYNTKIREFFDFYHTLWDIITPNKPILDKIRQ